MQRVPFFVPALIAAAGIGVLAALISVRASTGRTDPFVGLWEYWENARAERKRYLSITKEGVGYAVLRADSAYAELAAVARGRGTLADAGRRLELAFPDGERFFLTLNGSNELVVYFDKPAQPEDISFSYLRSGAAGAEGNRE
jgi:hypothetical protein